MGLLEAEGKAFQNKELALTKLRSQERVYEQQTQGIASWHGRGWVARRRVRKDDTEEVAERMHVRRDLVWGARSSGSISRVVGDHVR